MAAPGPPFAGQPGRRASYDHPAADPGNRPQAGGRQAARRVVRARLQPPRRTRAPAPDPGTISVLAWLERASLPVSHLSDPRVIRAALDGLCTRLDGSPAAANTIARKRGVFHRALGYAVELGLLPANPISLVRWRAPKAAVAVSPATVASPAQVRAILTQVARIRPALAAFFGYLYYAALRPEEGRRAAPRQPHPPGTRPREDDPHRRLPAHRHRLDPHRHPVRAARPQAPSRRYDPRRPDPARAGRLAPPAPSRVRHCAGREAVPRRQGRRAQRVGLRPRLARRPPGRARPWAGRHRARPPPVRPAARRAFAVA